MSRQTYIQSSTYESFVPISRELFILLKISNSVDKLDPQFGKHELDLIPIFRAPCTVIIIFKTYIIF